MSDFTSESFLQLRLLAQAAVTAAEMAWRSQVPEALMAAVAGCGQALRALPAESQLSSGAPDPADEFAKERAFLWLWWGRLLVMADNPSAVQAGIDSLDQAIVRLRASCVHGQGDWAQPALAIAWMNRGQGCSRKDTPEDLATAVGCYDQAVLLLTDGDQNALGAALMNRAVNMMRLNKNDDAEKALELAVAALKPLAETRVAARRNLASAWSNLGLLRLQAEDAAGALAAHREAVSLLRPLVANGGVAGNRDLAARLLNLAQAADAAGETDAALDAGREALALSIVDGAEAGVHGLELALRARHGLCVTFGGILATKPMNAAARPSWIEEAGDLVEAGLAAYAGVNVNEGSGEISQLAARLFEYGAWLYRTEQPQFLAEFLLEHLDESEAHAKIAADAVVAARQAVVQRGFAEVETGDLDRSSGQLQGLVAVEERVREIYRRLNDASGPV